MIAMVLVIFELRVFLWFRVARQVPRSLDFKIGEPYYLLKRIVWISNIHDMDLTRIDLNLLLVYEALMNERHVSRAGNRLHLSQSATSSALRRLRETLNDELFVRTSDGMIPTPRALELEGPLRGALRDVRAALEGGTFDPVTAVHAFTISASDYDVALHIPRLSQRLSIEAPGVDLRILPHTNVDAVAQLDTAFVDLALGWFPRAPSRLHKTLLLEEEFVCVMRRGHPLASSLVKLEAFASAPHLLVTLVGDTTGIIDDILAERGLERRVAMTIPHFAAAPYVLAHTDLIAALPKRISDRFASQYGLVAKPLPFESYRTRHEMLWHPRVDKHPAHQWLRKALTEVIQMDSK